MIIVDISIETLKERQVNPMFLDNVCKYLNSLEVAFILLKKGIINENEIIKAESFLAKKHCIKPNSIYRANDLIIKSKRVINTSTKKE